VASYSLILQYKDPLIVVWMRTASCWFCATWKVSH